MVSKVHNKKPLILCSLGGIGIAFDTVVGETTLCELAKGKQNVGR